MTVLGRLWRRAPAFRACLFVALAASLLAAMFPPHLPSIGALPGSQGPGPGVDAHPRYAPPVPPPPLDYSTIDLPPMNASRSTLIPFAGRQVPLPVGKWAEVALLRSGGPLAMQAAVLGRVQSGAMSGMVVVIGTPPVTPLVAGPPLENPCGDGLDPAMHALTPGQDCWNVARVDTAQLRGPDSRDPLVKRALERLDKLGVILPAQMSAASYYIRSKDGNGLTVRILLAGTATGPAVAAAEHRTEAWMRRWAPLLHRGFGGGLTPASVTAQLARDPAAEPGPS